MLRSGPFIPLVPNGHLLTVLANYWPRRLDERRYPPHQRVYSTEPGVQIVVHEHRPDGDALGEVVIVHGLEGSSQAGYIRSLAQAALQAGFAVHRFNIRSCGEGESLCRGIYHAGLTSDLEWLVFELKRQGRGPVIAVGFSLGGNMVIKLAGELQERAPLAAVCGVSVPLDLAACARGIAEPGNRLYEMRFLRNMKRRTRARGISPGLLDNIRSVFEFDDLITGPSFGFRGALHYYETQSARNFLKKIRVPALLIQAQDDPLVPFRVFQDPELWTNPYVRLLAPKHGGHVGFISRRKPRNWLDSVIVEWASGLRNNTSDLKEDLPLVKPVAQIPHHGQNQKMLRNGSEVS
jgi:predicted alpha/beta-fold hydrolase